MLAIQEIRIENEQIAEKELVKGSHSQQIKSTILLSAFGGHEKRKVLDLISTATGLKLWIKYKLNFDI